PVGLDEKKGLGGTIYFSVLDRREGTKGDAWGTGIRDFDTWFVAGLDSPNRTLDTSARYLYLYQIVNDSKRDGVVQDMTIRLLVDPASITSWGHFAEKKDKVLRGVGFTAVFHKEKEDVILPVSMEYQAVSDKQYLSPAPHHLADKLFGFATIPLKTKDVP